MPLNNKNLNSEIETSDIFKQENETLAALNNKNLNSEIETPKSSHYQGQGSVLSITRISILRLKPNLKGVCVARPSTLNNKNLNSEIETALTETSAYDLMRLLNNKNLNSEIETGSHPHRARPSPVYQLKERFSIMRLKLAKVRVHNQY